MNKINKIYFTKYQGTGLFLLNTNSTLEDLKKYLDIIDIISNLRDQNKGSYDSLELAELAELVELAKLVKDLEGTMNSNKTEWVYLSEFGKKLSHKQSLAETKVKKQLQDKLTPEGTEFIEILKNRFKTDSYIVGGFVRDAISNRDSNDIDFCTSIPYHELKRVFDELGEKGWKTKDTGKQFLVLNICNTRTKENFEVSALRKDKDNTGAEVGTIEEDSLRRDFVNSCIYFSLKTEKLIDPSGKAIIDCENNILRFMGKPQDRIKEDPARVFRCYKMIQRGWKPVPKTLKAIRENFDFAIKNTSSTRIMNEIESMVNL